MVQSSLQNFFANANFGRHNVESFRDPLTLIIDWCEPAEFQLCLEIIYGFAPKIKPEFASRFEFLLEKLGVNYLQAWVGATVADTPRSQNL